MTRICDLPERFGIHFRSIRATQLAFLPNCIHLYRAAKPLHLASVWEQLLSWLRGPQDQLWTGHLSISWECCARADKLYDMQSEGIWGAVLVWTLSAQLVARSGADSEKKHEWQAFTLPVLEVPFQLISTTRCHQGNCTRIFNNAHQLGMYGSSMSPIGTNNWQLAILSDSL